MSWEWTLLMQCMWGTIVGEECWLKESDAGYARWLGPPIGNEVKLVSEEIKSSLVQHCIHR